MFSLLLQIKRGPPEKFKDNSDWLNPILDNGGQICPPPPAAFFNTAQNLLGVGSWNFVTFSFNIKFTLSNSFWSLGTLGVAMTMLYLRGVWPKNTKNGHKIMVFVSYCPKSSPILKPCARFELNWSRNKKVTENLIFDGTSGLRSVLKLQMTSYSDNAYDVTNFF